MIIDAHIHLWNRLHGDDYGVDRESLKWGKARQGNSIYYATPPSFEDSLSTYERALAHMDYLGIERAVVLQEFMDGKQDDYLADVRRLEPARFSCMALFDRYYLDDAMEAFKKAIDGKKLQGFLVRTPDPFPEIATAKLQDMWQVCAERGLPIVLKNGNPDEARKLIKLVPNIKVVFSHFAGSSGSKEDFKARLQIAADYPDVYIDTGGFTYGQRYPFAQAKEHLQFALEYVSAEKISWGSDYPRPGLVTDASHKQQLEFITIECSFLSDRQKQQILSETALKVYKWE
jgi:L-galactono-1,5-lactonase